MSALTEDMKRLVREQRLGYIATVTADGQPNVSPKGSLSVWDDDHLVFADIESPGTVRNLGNNPSTEINVVDPRTRKGYRFRGRASVLRSGEIYWKVVEKYKKDGADVRRIRTIILVNVVHAAMLVSPVYLTGLTEEEVGAIWDEYRQKSSKKLVVDLVPPNDF